MKRFAILSYGVVCYALFLATFLYAIGFIGNFGVPHSLDANPSRPLFEALMINLGLLSLFALQHSGMARQGFKRWWTRWVPAAAERSTYVLLSSVALILIFIFWQPMGGLIWNVEGEAGRTAIITIYMFGWALVLVSTFMIDHFDLFGLAQVWRHFRGKAYSSPEFRVPVLYRIVRHPLYVGWLVVFWAAPTMTVAHLLFAVVTSIYIIVAIQLEERDLIDFHGDQYVDYRKRVPMLNPLGRRKSASA